MRRSSGFTLAEVLVAAALVALAATTLILAQLGSLRSSVRSRVISETKAAANVRLEKVTADLLRSDIDPYSGDRLYWFEDYYFGCARPLDAAQLGRPLRISPASDCGGSVADATWTIGALDGDATGLDGEGQILVTVVATRPDGPDGTSTLTLAGLVSCYDAYPRIKAVPKPCPTPGNNLPASGGTP